MDHNYKFMHIFLNKRDFFVFLSSIKINYTKFFLITLILLPFVDGYLRIRLGAGWELYLPIIFFVFASIIAKQGKIELDSFILIFFVSSLALLFVSNIYGFFFYIPNVNVPNIIIEQIKDPIFRVIVESIRYTGSITFMIVTLHIFKQKPEVFRDSLKFFLIGWFIQVVYVIYEVIIVKIINLQLPLLKPPTGNILTIPRGYGTFYEPSQCGQYLLIGLILLHIFKRISELIGVYNFFSKNFIFINILGVFALILTVSRTAFLAAVIAFLFYILLSLQRKKFFRFKNMGLIMIYLIGVSYLLFTGINKVFGYEYWKTLIEQTFYGTYQDSIASRISLYIYVLNQVFKYWIEYNYILGIGLGLSIIEFSMIPFYLQYMLELGLMSFVLLLIFKSLLLIRLFKIKDLQLRILSLVLFICLAVILANYNSFKHAWIWFILAILYYIPRYMQFLHLQVGLSR